MHLANTMWAYVTMEREPGEGMMRELEGRTEALSVGGHVQDTGGGKHTVGACDDGEGAMGGDDEFAGMTTATSGVLARFPWLLPVRNSFASYLVTW